MVLDLAVQAEHTDVFLAGALLRLDQPGGALYAHDQTSRHLRVERAAVAGLLDTQDALDPRDDLVGGGVGWLV